MKERRMYELCRLFLGGAGVWFVLSVICIVNTVRQSSAQEYGVHLIDRIKKEAPPAWNAYFRFFNGYKTEYSETLLEKGIVAETSDCSFFLSYPYILHERTYRKDNGDSMRRTVVFNPRYRFVLKRHKEDTEWAIDTVMPMNANIPADIENLHFPALSENNTPSIELYIGNSFMTGFRFAWGDWFPYVFEQPEFHILSAEEFCEDEETLVRMRYEYNPPGKRNQLLRGGEVILYPNRFWLVKQARVELSDPDGSKAEVEINNTYDFSSDNAMPFLKSHSMHVNVKGYEIISRRIFTDYQKVENAGTERFTLSHYGIPEPDVDGTKKRSPIHYDILTLGIILLLLGLWTLYRNRKK